jgi:hypothetical protein
MSNLIRLEIYKNELIGMFGEDNKFIKTSIKIIDTEISKALEYSISIDGAGRAEFIKANYKPKEDEDEDEKEKTIVDQIAERLG